MINPKPKPNDNDVDADCLPICRDQIVAGDPEEERTHPGVWGRITSKATKLLTSESVGLTREEFDVNLSQATKKKKRKKTHKKKTYIIHKST